MRYLQSQAARAWLVRAELAARQSGIAALCAVVDSAARMLNSPAARLICQGEARPLLLDEVQALLASTSLVVDGCRSVVRCAGMSVSLATRPFLFTLVRTLAEAWPANVSRGTLIAKAFRLKFSDESHRARLRVEIGRLRAALKPLAIVIASKREFALVTQVSTDVVLLMPPVEARHAGVFVLLADGESWSSSALALGNCAGARFRGDLVTPRSAVRWPG